MSGKFYLEIIDHNCNGIVFQLKDEKVKIFKITNYIEKEEVEVSKIYK